MSNYFLFFQENIFLFAIWFCLVFVFLFSLFQSFLSKATSLSVHNFVSMINQEQSMVIDLRSRDSFDSNHIVNSRNVSLDESFLDKVKSLISNKDVNILLVCGSGGSVSNSAAKILSKSGYLNTYKLEGGIANWLYFNMPTKIN